MIPKMKRAANEWRSQWAFIITYVVKLPPNLLPARNNFWVARYSPVSDHSDIAPLATQRTHPLCFLLRQESSHRLIHPETATYG